MATPWTCGTPDSGLKKAIGRTKRMAKPQTQHLENLVAERMVLGKVLQSEASFWSIADALQSFHFANAFYGQIYQAVRDVLTEGKRMSLAILESRLGPEYDEDGKSTSSLLTALLRDAENNESALDEVEGIIDHWRHRKLIETLEHGLKEAKKPNVMPADLLSDMEVKIKDISVNSQAEPLKWLGDIAVKVLTRSSKTKETGIVPGFDTGLPTLDQLIGRVHAGDLGFIGARAGDAKTVLAFQMAMRAQHYAPGIFFELEMKDEDLTARAMAGETNVPVAEIEAGSYDAFALEDLKSARDKLKGTRIVIDDRPKLAIEQMRDRCVAMKRRHGLGFAVVDHIRLVRTFNKSANKFDRIEFVTGDLKALAKDLGIAVIALSQVTRSSQRRDDPFPNLTDLDGGGSIEQDADWCVSLFRRDRWLKNQRPQEMDSKDGREWAEQMQRWKNRIEARCLKRRRGEDGETAEFEFDGRRGQLREVER
ncbi:MULTISPECIES: DnaB-like helicase C-terminal domain-containing protein [unclassified Mesorhizobium]|uniref:replicative DNA helicase n=3 Tax=Phyllobacteriaceae TaxID=69277 RepID=UPI001FE0A5DF|nr:MULTISPECIES: DnaB-like helicase C-terminal domain-containing protein [unclassified Mesorhizobium]MDF3208395.1 DnaB-like helicase C-terminal domain-containing protein [Mesorhizobium sp. LMG15046]